MREPKRVQACSKCGEDFVISQAHPRTTRCPDCRPVGNADGVQDVYQYMMRGATMRLFSGLWTLAREDW